MKSISFSLLFVALLSVRIVDAQNITVDKVKFFEDSSILTATITTDVGKLFRQKQKEGLSFPARFSATLADGTVVNEPVTLETRGHFRKNFCYIPPLKVSFKSDKNSVMRPLGSLKLVNQCSEAGSSQTYLLEEYLVYKIYNLFTNLSFRVRLLNLTIIDSAGKKKPVNEYAFLLEDDKELAKRNNCKIWKTRPIADPGTDRYQMTVVALFEYMIGNTDWSVWARHNIRLLLSKTDSSQHFYPVPYDFDYSGFVNTYYAVPAEGLDITKVRERSYRGFPRTVEELNEALLVFKNQKNNIYSLINNFKLLKPGDKKDLTMFLDDFFEMIDQPKRVRNAFIENARRY